MDLDLLFEFFCTADSVVVDKKVGVAAESMSRPGNMDTGQHKSQA